MEKEVTIEEIVKNSEERPRSERKRIYRTNGGRHVHGFGRNEDEDNRGQGFKNGRGGGAGLHLNRKHNDRHDRFNGGEDRGEGRHIFNGRRDGDGPHHGKDGCNVKPKIKKEPLDRGHRFYNEREVIKSKLNVETKLFTDKDELVKYVNGRKADNSEVEVYKIEDGLYKLVIRN